MTKVSDYARSKLNKLGIDYFKFFIVIFAFCILRTMSLTHKWIITVVHISRLEAFFLIFISFLLLVQWLPRRAKIIKDYKKDKKRQWDIKDYRDSIASEELTKIYEDLLDKNLTFVGFIDIKEDESLGCKILLNWENCGSDISREIKTSVNFYAKNLISIDGIDGFVVLPDPYITKNLLEQALYFISSEYRRRKDMFTPDCTFTAVVDAKEDLDKKIYEILEKNYQDVLRLLLSKKEFKVAGKKIKEGAGKEFFLITSVIIEEEKYALLPTRAIKTIFSRINDIVFRDKI